MLDKKIIDWIKDGEAKGYGKKQLIELLIKNGWARRDIDESFKYLKESRKQDKHSEIKAKGASNYNFFDNLKYLIAKPNIFFDKIKEEPVKYALSSFFALLILMGVIQYVFTFFSRSLFLGGYGYGYLGLFGFLPAIMMILVALFSFIHLGIITVVVKAFKVNSKAADTVKVFCYSMLPYLILTLVPFIGGFAIIYSYSLMIIGLSKIHGISKGNAAVAVLLPVIFVAGLIALFIFYLFFNPPRVPVYAI